MASAPDCREVARRVLRRVESKGAFATLALSGELDRAKLSPADRGLATEIVYGVLRNKSRIDRALADKARKGLRRVAPAILVALRVGAYQLMFLERVPAHAAVNDAVEAAKRVAGVRVGGFVNGVLRSIERDGEPALPDRDRAREYATTALSMPGWLLDELESDIGETELVAAAEAFNRAPPLVARVNRARISRDDLIELLRSEGERVEAQPVDIAPDAIIVRGLGSPESSASFQDGQWTVQDVGAQLIAHLLGVRSGTILDACSGVGGKALHLAGLAPDLERIDAADNSQRKLDLLADGARRLGTQRVHPILTDLTAADASIEHEYDGIILDAPCSGLGVLRRHPEAKWRDGANIAELAGIQARLLDAVVSRVRPGGALVYSVCTFAAAECSEQIAAFLLRHPYMQLAPPPPDDEVDWSTLIDSHGYLRTWPHRHDADAFFAARMIRRA